MKLRIGHTVYDVQEALERASLNNIYAMTAQTGIGMGSLSSGLEDIDQVGIEAAFDNPKLLAVLRAMIFLTRRYVGEPHTVESANDFPMVDMEFIADEGDEIVTAEDPTLAPMDSDPVGAEPEPPAEIPTRTGSKTSAKRSPSVSP